MNCLLSLFSLITGRQANLPMSHKVSLMVKGFSVLLHSESPAAYRTLRESCILCLPGELTLRDFTNYVAPSQGFQPEVTKNFTFFVIQKENNSLST